MCHPGPFINNWLTLWTISRSSYRWSLLYNNRTHCLPEGNVKDKEKGIVLEHKERGRVLWREESGVTPNHGKGTYTPFRLHVKGYRRREQCRESVSDRRGDTRDSTWREWNGRVLHPLLETEEPTDDYTHVPENVTDCESVGPIRRCVNVGKGHQSSPRTKVSTPRLTPSKTLWRPLRSRRDSIVNS